MFALEVAVRAAGTAAVAYVLHRLFPIFREMLEAAPRHGGWGSP